MITDGQVKTAMTMALRETDPEYVKWLEQNHRLEAVLLPLLDTFYQITDAGQQATINLVMKKELTIDLLPMLFLEMEIEAMEQVMEELYARRQSGFGYIVDPASQEEFELAR